MDLEELIRAAKDGDAIARENLGRWLVELLYPFFAEYFRAQDVDELVQKTGLVVFEKLDTFEYRGPDAFRNWVISVASRHAMSRTRESHRARARERKVRERPRTPMLSPTSMLAEREALEILDELIEQLPAHEREAVRHWLDGGTVKELAELAGISTSAAKSRRFNGRRHLETLYELQRRSPPSSDSPSPGRA